MVGWASEQLAGRILAHNDHESTNLSRLNSLVALTLQRSREGHLPWWTQVAEMTSLYFISGIGPNYYHYAGFWRREVSWKDKTSHLGTRAYRKFINRVNPAAYRKLSQNKVSEKALLSLFGIPTAGFVGLLDPSHGHAADGQPLRSAADLARLCGSLRTKRICFKLLEGWRGEGFAAAEVVRSAGEVRLRPLLQQQTLSTEQFCTDVLVLGPRSPRLIEEYLEQHPVLAALNPSSLNTARLWVYREHGSAPRVVGSSVKAGRTGALVDNASGALVIPMNGEAGILKAAIVDSVPTRQLYPAHPDHGARIEGIEVPFWRETQELACRALSVFPGMRFAGIDVAILSSGPVIVELNAFPDKEGQIDCERGVRSFA